MEQRCVHYTEPDNGSSVLYAPNQWYWDGGISANTVCSDSSVSVLESSTTSATKHFKDDNKNLVLQNFCPQYML